MRPAKAIFWASLAGIAHTHLTYPLTLAALERLHRGRGRGGAGRRLHPPGRRPAPDGPSPTPAGGEDPPPRVSLIVAAFDEEEVIEAKVANALALDYPREQLELVVASDGSGDRTVELARAAGADIVLELPRGGKLSTQDAAVERSSGEIVAFSDANSLWDADALRMLVAPFDEQDVGYVCGQVAYLDPAGDNEEGAYWRLEMKVRELESALGGITAGNGGIYAVRRAAYRPLAPSRSHDLSFPFMLRKAGWRSLYAPGARAEERMVPTLEGEFARKRRMMVGIPDIVAADRMWDPRGYGPLYAFEILSHRVLRYASPALHALAFGSNLTLLGTRPVYRIALAAQAGLLGLAAVAGLTASRLPRIARYYVLVTASIALGCWDRWRDGPPAAWEKSEGTR